MTSLTLGQLHRLSGKAISKLPGLVAIRHEGELIAFLSPLRDGTNTVSIEAEVIADEGLSTHAW